MGIAVFFMTAKIVQTDRFWIAAVTGLLLIPLPIRLSKEPLIFPRSMARLGAVHGTRRERGFRGVLLETSFGAVWQRSLSLRPLSWSCSPELSAI